MIIYLCKENVGYSYQTLLKNYANNLNRLILAHPLDKFIILGDFNFKSEEDWLTTNIGGCELIRLDFSCQYITEFFDTLDITNRQYIGMRNMNDRLLELVFSNDRTLVREYSSPLAEPIENHHRPFIIEMGFSEIHKLHVK